MFLLLKIYFVTDIISGYMVDVGISVNSQALYLSAHCHALLHDINSGTSETLSESPQINLFLYKSNDNYGFSSQQYNP